MKAKELLADLSKKIDIKGLSRKFYVNEKPLSIIFSKKVKRDKFYNKITYDGVSYNVIIFKKKRKTRSLVDALWEGESLDLSKELLNKKVLTLEEVAGVFKDFYFKS